MAQKIRAIANARAAYAFEKVKGFVKKAEKEPQKQREYRSYLKKMPAMVQVNGLGETLAFYYAKGGVYREIYEQIAEWIQKKMPFLIDEDNQGEKKDFIEILVNMESPKYRLVTMEVLALLNWMHRFAEGMIDVKESAQQEQ